MARYRAQVSLPMDTAFPRDAMVVTPCFKTTAIGDAGAQSIADDLCAGVETWFGAAVNCTTKLYDLDETPSGPPVAQKTVNGGASPLTSQCPRDVALCLSFYADSNTARRRGRLFLPAPWVLKHSATSSVGREPTTAQQTACKDWATIMAGIGGLVCDWVVWSGASHDAHTVTNYYVDNEWDTQRKRGLRPTSRITGTTSG